MSTLTPDKLVEHNKLLAERWASMRSHARATASLRLQLEWDEGDARRSANGLTVDVSHSGCMAVIGADVPLHRQVKLILPETGRSTSGEVVWRGHEAWEVGIALDQPDASFWGVKI
ncbi:MAG TPA: PilZ domain-containing protein [Candidatus Eisenbacteria bacterium]|nr:PilZ domain-containing protein [Candidatus Eisenbacteria bacterium]